MFTLLVIHVQCIVHYTGYMYGSTSQTKVNARINIIKLFYVFNHDFSCWSATEKNKNVLKTNKSRVKSKLEELRGQKIIPVISEKFYLHLLSSLQWVEINSLSNYKNYLILLKLFKSILSHLLVGKVLKIQKSF